MRPRALARIRPKSRGLVFRQRPAGPSREDLATDRFERRGRPAEAHARASAFRIVIERARLPARDRNLLQQPDRGLVIARRQFERAARLRRRKHLERDLGQHAEPAEAADHEFRHVETRGVLHHLAAHAQEAAGAVDEAHAEDEIPQPAETQPAGAVHAGGDGAAEGRAGFDEHRIERQVLALRGERIHDFRYRRSGARGEGELLRLVLDDAADPAHRHARRVDLREPRFRQPAGRDQARRGAHDLDQFLDRAGSGDDARRLRGRAHSRAAIPAFSSG